MTFLVQATYFASMFNGSWKESSDSEVRIEIPDSAIDANGAKPASFMYLIVALSFISALDMAFGSLYSDNVHFKDEDLISILAASCLLGIVRLKQFRLSFEKLNLI